VVSALTVPLRTSVIAPVCVQPEPVADDPVNVVDVPFAHLTTSEVDVVVPLVFPLPPVFPVQPVALVLDAPVVVFTEPDSLVHVIPWAVAPAGEAARAVNPAAGTRTAVAAIDPRTIRFLSTSYILLPKCGLRGRGRREKQPCDMAPPSPPRGSSLRSLCYTTIKHHAMQL
jgi:hypothetical protein